MPVTSGPTFRSTVFPAPSRVSQRSEELLNTTRQRFRPGIVCLCRVTPWVLGTLEVTFHMLPIQRSQRTGAPSCTNLRGDSYISSCSLPGSTEPLLWTPARFELEFPIVQTCCPSSSLDIFRQIFDCRNTPKSTTKPVDSASYLLTYSASPSWHCLGAPWNASTS